MTDDTERAAWLAGLKPNDEICVVRPFGKPRKVLILRVTPKLLFVGSDLSKTGTQFKRATGSNSYERLIPSTDEAVAQHNAERVRKELENKVSYKLCDLTDDQLSRIAAIVNEQT